MRINRYYYEEYLEKIKSFHGGLAPGMIIGGLMVDLALKHLPEGEFFDVICETPSCLPDAVQLLTPCTIGNGWLKIIDFGRYALTMYEKFHGKGVRVFLDPSKIDNWDEVKCWFYKLKPKKEQNSNRLYKQIKDAGHRLFSFQVVHVQSHILQPKSKGQIATCPLCGEAYPVNHGGCCRGCQSETPYFFLLEQDNPENSTTPLLHAIPAQQSAGYRVMHDMTRIVPEKSKGPAFKNGQAIMPSDITRLEQMGKQRLYVKEKNQIGAEWVHEDEAALAFAKVMAGKGVNVNENPQEGKATLNADHDGLFVVEKDRLEQFNLSPDVMCASLKNYTIVSRGQDIAGTRAIPLFLSRKFFYKALAALNGKPLFQVLPMRKAQVGILVTGTEVCQGLVEDKFIPLIISKIEKFDCTMVKEVIVPDDREKISQGIKDIIKAGADLLVTTGGLSIDPDDVTRQGIKDAGATEILHGAPILPGAMTLLARIDGVQVLGVPAGALYYQTTAFDLLLPRLLAGLNINRRDLSKMGHGAFYL